MSKNVKRLFDQFIPENYKLDININSEDMTFAGTVVITGKKVGRPSKRLTFHQHELTISEAKVTRHDKSTSKTIELDRINHHNSLQEVRLHSGELLYPGRYEIFMDFKGTINDNMNGIYPCYFEHDGKTKKLIATQFESHHAREAFPCIDEPIAKATFDLRLTAPKDNVFLSNMPEASSRINQKFDTKTVTFESTPIMSTYLLAFVCGELHSLESKTKNNVVVRTWATVAQPKVNLKHALSEAVAIQEYFEDYFQTQFPLPKCDHVALPDFDAGAMENWGLITYREVALLTDPKNRSIPSEQYVSLVVSHELSHQWFGNLVTMAWWDDLWLNESFASIMEHIPLDALHPDWHQWETYTSYDVISASNRDVFSDVQNVGIGVNHPDEIRSLFDGAIVYSKGGRLIKMLREYVGDEVLRKALKQYFKDHAYHNATREDLWGAIESVTGQSISSLMGPWISQSGMPLLSVTKSNQSTREVKQSRFVFDKTSDSQLWPVPLLASQAIEPVLLESESTTFTLSDVKKPYILNKNGSGHYVVRYQDNNDYQNVVALINSQQISSEARINILNDQLLLARRGDISLAEVLLIIKGMRNEPRSAVWDMALRGISYASSLGENVEAIESSLQKLRYDLAFENYQKLGWLDNENDDPNTASLRATMSSLMLSSKNPEMINFVLNYYNDTNLDDIPADRRSLVFSTVIKHGKNIKDITTFVDLYKTSQNPDLLNALAAGLCSTEDPSVAENLLHEGLKEKGFVKPQDYFRWYAYLSRNKYTRNVAWEYLKANWDRFYTKFAGGINIDYFVSLPAAPIYTADKQKQFNNFFDSKKDIIRISRAIKVAQAEINARVEWRNRDLKTIEHFFKSAQ